MKFPDSVPVKVQSLLSKLIEGVPKRHKGYFEMLQAVESELTRIDEATNDALCNPLQTDLDELRRQKLEAINHRDWLAEELSCLKRLGHHRDMPQVFELLHHDFPDGEKVEDFIYCAWAARIDFAKYREGLKKASKIKQEIAEVSNNLSKLLHMLSDTGVMGPGELFSIPELLKQTDNHNLNDHNLQMWRSMRMHILGDKLDKCFEDSSINHSEQVSNQPVNIRIIPIESNIKIDPAEEQRHMLRYAWGTAPDVSALIETISKAAFNFQPKESDMIGATVQTRQHSQKTEYIRALWFLLSDSHKFLLTLQIRKAICLVANVVLDSPEIGVTLDDVNKALKEA